MTLGGLEVDMLEILHTAIRKVFVLLLSMPLTESSWMFCKYIETRAADFKCQVNYSCNSSGREALGCTFQEDGIAEENHCGDHFACQTFPTDRKSICLNSSHLG